MAASSRNRPLRARLAAGGGAVLLGCAAVVALAASAAEPRAPRRDAAVTLDAASSDVDYRSNTVVFRDIVITQGAVRVAAAQARATGLDFEDSTWNFTGAVRINVDGGALRSEDATVKFGANRVSSARIRGNPAEFEQARSGSSDLARGRAATIEYDVNAGTVKLIGDAWLSDGRNEIRGQQLTYDVRGQRVQSGTRPGQSDRVQITIRPRDAGETAAPDDGAPGPNPPPSTSTPATPPESAPAPGAPPPAERP
jgi:lipopolysaccharide transport protein LptA